MFSNIFCWVFAELKIILCNILTTIIHVSLYNICVHRKLPWHDWVTTVYCIALPYDAIKVIYLCAYIYRHDITEILLKVAWSTYALVKNNNAVERQRNLGYRGISNYQTHACPKLILHAYLLTPFSQESPA